MAAPVSLLGPAGSLASTGLPRPAVANSQGGGEVFATLLQESISRVHHYQQTAEQSMARFLSGEDEELHRVAMATQQAEVALELFLQVRNKVVNAYQEIMRMQI